MDLTREEIKTLVDIYKFNIKKPDKVPKNEEIFRILASKHYVAFTEINSTGDILDFSKIRITHEGKVKAENYLYSIKEKKHQKVWEILKLLLSALFGALLSKPFWELLDNIFNAIHT